MNKVCSINVGEIVLENKDFNGVIDSNKIDVTSIHLPRNYLIQKFTMLYCSLRIG